MQELHLQVYVGDASGTAKNKCPRSLSQVFHFFENSQVRTYNFLSCSLSAKDIWKMKVRSLLYEKTVHGTEWQLLQDPSPSGLDTWRT